MRHFLGFYQPATWVQLASSAKAIGPIRQGSLCLALPTRGLTCQHAIPHSKILSAARGRSPQKLQISLEGLEGGQPDAGSQVMPRARISCGKSGP
jgi:hypothetical protein